jgi:hypothetical protein
MAHRLRGEFTNKLRQQAIFELLGPTFVAVYFPHHEVGTALPRKGGTALPLKRILPYATGMYVQYIL